MEICNVCGSKTWADMGARKRVRCASCNSLERTRIMKLYLDYLKVPTAGMRVLHIAPEPGLSKFFQSIPNIQYQPVDFNPGSYGFCNAKKLDLCTDSKNLPQNYYDLIVHSHVLEHVKCNVSAVFYYLNKSLKENGYHIFSIPVINGFTEECFSPMSAEEATRRFGQSDHVRNFGLLDFENNLGMLFNENGFGFYSKPDNFSLYKVFDKSVLDLRNIPETDRCGLTPSSVFVVRKEDFKLQLAPNNKCFKIDNISKNNEMDYKDVKRERCLKKPNKPFISILMPTFNYAEFIKEAIDSVLEQDFINFELIISDNASTDNTEEIVSHYLSDDRVIYSRNSENLGMMANFIKLMSLVKGEYCAVLCSDDFFLSGHLNKLASVVESRPDVDLVYSNVFYVNDKSSINSVNEHFGLKDFNYIGLRNEFSSILAYGLHIKAQSSIVRTSLYQSYIASVDNNLMKGFTALDTDMFLDFSRSGKLFAFVNSVSSVHRKHDKQATGHSTYHRGQHLKDNLLLWEKYLNNDTAFYLTGYEDQFLRFIQFNLDLLNQYPDEAAQLIPQLMGRIDAIRRKVVLYKEQNIQRKLSGQPLVSVIMPTKNRPELLQYALESVNQQTYANWQAIVINDGGCDVEGIVKKIDAGRNNIHYINLSYSKGHAAARNIGLEFSQGEILTYLDDDNVYFPNHIETVVNVLVKKDCSVVFTQGEWVAEKISNGERIDVSKEHAYKNNQHSLDNLSVGNYIDLNVLAHRKSCLYKVAGFDEELTALVDWDLVLGLATEYGVERDTTVTAQIRTRVDNVDNVSRKERKNFLQLFQKIYAKHPSDNKLVRQARERYLIFLKQEQNETLNTPSVLNDTQINNREKIAVIIHLKDVEIFDELQLILSNLTIQFDLYITIAESDEKGAKDNILKVFPHAQVYILPDKGRDILPFLGVFKEIQSLNYKLILKLHASQIVDSVDSRLIAQQKNAFRSLLQWNKRVDDVIDLFDLNPKLGVFAPEGDLQKLTSGDLCFQQITQLIPHIEKETFNKNKFHYPVNSMFWFRPEALDLLLKLDLQSDNFSLNTDKEYGNSFEQVIDRLFGILCRSSGYILTDRMPKIDDIAYQSWLEEKRGNDLSRDMLSLSDNALKPLIHCLVFVESNDLTHLADTLDSLGGQTYLNWHLSVISDLPCPNELFNEMPQLNWVQIESAFDIQSALVSTDVKSDWFGLLAVGDYLEPYALSLCVEYVNKFPDWQVIYTDEDRVSPEGLFHSPKFKPDFNQDLLYSVEYIGGLTLFKTESLAKCESINYSSVVTAYDLVLHYLDSFNASVIGHIDNILMHRKDNVDDFFTRYEDVRKTILLNHFQRNNVAVDIDKGAVEGSFYLQYASTSTPLITIIIPTKNRLDLIQACLESILEKTSYSHYEIIIVDNQSDDGDTLSYLSNVDKNERKVRVLSYPHAYNYSAINNFAVEHANGEYVVLLNNDTYIIQQEWLTRLIIEGQRKEIGVVGARLIYANQTLQHAGVVLGMGPHGVADHPSLGEFMDSSGYMARTQVVQNFSAVTAACLLIEKQLFLQVGGLDEDKFKVLFNDVDLCLKVRELGYKVLWTPFVTVVHHGSSSLKKEKQSKEKLKRAQSEVDNMLTKWLPLLAKDPAFNRNLSLKHLDFQIETKTNVSWNVDFHDKPRVFAFPCNDSGVGEYRVRAPLRGLTNRGDIQSSLLPNHDESILPDIVEIECVKPDVLFLQNIFEEQFIEAWGKYEKFNDAFMIYGQDDLNYALPKKHPLQGRWPKDMRRRLKRILNYSDRLIVANEPLAEAFGKMIEDVVVVPNYLETSRWLNLQMPTKNPRKKLRIGWAGGGSHRGDLELIYPVILSLCNEVDWVFMGMCPDLIKSYVREIHPGVAFEDYPQTLADLDLDLAIAPLEHNNFNQAKTNLRLLEYGAMGWPVVCTDIFPYQGAPVTLVANNTDHWVKTIREKINEPDALEKEGQVLRQWVIDRYILEDHLDEWLLALKPS